MDVDKEQALATAIRALMAKISGLTRDKAETRCDEAKVKIDAATLDSAIVAAFPRDFQSDIRDFLNGYRAQVETLASAHSSLEKLRKHKSAKSFPMALNSIKVPLAQFSRAYLQAPEADANWGRYALPQGGSAVFATYVERQVQHLKSEILKNWVSEKEQEVRFLESRALAVSAIGQFEEVVDVRHASLKARYDHLDGQPRYREIIRDVDFMGVVSRSLASGVIAKVNSLVRAEEDRKLATALKKMDLDKPAVAAAAQAPPNDNAELKKIVLDLGKKVDLLSKKVHDYLFCLLCACADLLSLGPPLLKQLLVDLVEAGWEEARRKETPGKTRQGSAHRKEKGQESRSRRGRRKEIQGKERQRQGRRTLDEAEVEGQQEEKWQEVGAAFLLSFSQTDSVSVSGLGLFDFSDSYGLDWALLVTDMRFLCMSYPPSILHSP